MKKIITMIILAVVTTAMYANGECSSLSGSAFSAENKAIVVDDTKPNYRFNIQANSMAKYLYLAEEQKSDVEQIHSGFMASMRKAANTEDAKKARKIARYAVSNDLWQMRNVLTEWQFDRYKAVIYTTMQNRGIKY